MADWTPRRMSWPDARRIAREYATLMIARVRDAEQSSGQRAGSIRLTDFEDEACYRFLKGPDAWPLDYHRMITRACAREIRKAGYRSEIVTIRLADYWRWLESQNLMDAPEHRAQFIVL